MKYTLTKQKQKKLQSKGWKVGTASDFLGLSKKESNRIEKKRTSRKLDKNKTIKTQKK